MNCDKCCTLGLALQYEFQKMVVVLLKNNANKKQGLGENSRLKANVVTNLYHITVYFSLTLTSKYL